MLILDAAISYSKQLSWQLVPLHAGKKTPWLKAWQRNASNDPDIVKSWFSQRPDSNIGLRLGQLIDIEADDDEGQRTADELLSGILTPTWDSARGTHRLFQSPEDPLTDLAVTKAAGLEVRLGTNGKGAQSVLPPSVHPGGKVLAWRPGLSPFDVPPAAFPDSVRQLLLAKPVANDNDGFVLTFEDDDLASASGASEGNRHERLMRLAGTYLARHGCDEKLLSFAYAWAQRCTPPMSPERVKKEVMDLVAADARKRLQHSQQQFVQPTVVQPPKPLAYQPFPVAMFPEPLSSFVSSAAKTISCDESFVALPVLACCASAIGNARCFEINDDWREPALLWLGPIGYPGDKKTPSLSAATLPLVDAQRELVAEHAETMSEYERNELLYQASLKDWKSKGYRQGEPPPQMCAPPPQARLWADDATIEGLGLLLADNPRGLLLRKDELTAWFRSFCEYKGKGGDLQRWLSIYNTTAVCIDRASKSLYLPQPNVSIVGGIQPAVLKSFFSGDYVDAGLLQRFVFAFPPARASKLSRFGIGSGVSREYADVIRALQSLPFEDELTTMRLDDAAWDLFAAWHDFAEREKQDCCILLKGVISKLTATAVRLGGILHCVRQVTGEASAELVVDHESLRLGVGLARWFWDEWQRVYQLQQETAEKAEDRRLFDWICSNHRGRITPSVLGRSIRGIGDTADADTVLQRLAARGWGSMQFVEPTNRGGRPTCEFVAAVAETS